MYHYNAFISYNHNPRDNKIAAALQNQLENYRIPKGIRTSSGLTRIERVFLDKGELEVAGDLNKVICDALEDTDYLIVICSPESKKSIWVQREIDYFLQFHSIDNILTVISDGEPFDVLPEILLKGDREPLSCDYRQPMRTARNVELTRLVAALIGCRYDDLVQRQRHYRMRRMIIALSAAAVVLLSAVTYLIWSNGQIKSSLESSQREQSATLSIQSEQALKSGDRISALDYAIKALPSEEQDRPVVSQAVLALSRAMNIYKTEDATRWKNALRRYPAYGKRHIALHSLEKNGHNYVAELYSNGRCVLWDADTGRELMADYTSDLMKNGSDVQNMTFSNTTGDLILITEKSVRIVDPERGSETKVIPITGEYFKIYDFNDFMTKCDPVVVRDDSLWIPIATVSEAELPDDYSVRTNSVGMENAAAVFGRDSEEIAQLVLYQRRKQISDISYKIVRIDLKTGKIAAETPAPVRPTKITISPNGKYLTCCYSNYYDTLLGSEVTDDQIAVLDPEDLSDIGSVSSTFVSDFGFDSHNRLILCGFDKMPEGSDTTLFNMIDYSINGSNRTYSFSVDRNLEIKCFDPDSCDELWSRTRSIHAGGLPWLTVTGKDQMISDAVICTTGNSILITDADGKEIENLYALSGVTRLGSTEDTLIAVLDDGEITAWTYEKDHKLRAITEYNVLLGPAKDYVDVGPYAFSISSDSESNTSPEIMTQYDDTGFDPKLEAYGYDESVYKDKGTVTFTDADWIGDTFVEIRKEQAAAGGKTSRGAVEIIVRDISSGDILLEKEVNVSSPREDSDADEARYTSFKYSGIDRARGKVYFLDNNDYFVQTLLSVDLKTGKEEKTVLNIRKPESVIEDARYPSMYDVLSPVDHYSAYENTAGIFSVYDGHIYYAAVEGSLNETEGEAGYNTYMIVLEADPETGEGTVHRISGPIENFDTSLYVKVRINSACRRLISSEDAHFTSYGFDGKTIWSGDELAYDPAGFTCADDGTVIALENGGSEAVLHFYSPDNGSERATVSLGSVHILSHEKMSCEYISDEETMITAGDDAYLLDSDTWELRTTINDDYIAYSPQARQFMIGDPEKRKTWHVPYRTLQEMITEARESLE